MRYWIPLYCLALLLSCSGPDPDEQLKNLPGYWEISEVIQPDGTSKKFRINTTVDHLSLEGKEGTRRKVYPRLDGSFKTNRDVERFRVVIEQDSLRLYYETPFDRWKETVLEVGDDLIRIRNRDGKEYIYNRFTTFTIKDQPLGTNPEHQ